MAQQDNFEELATKASLVRDIKSNKDATKMEAHLAKRFKNAWYRPTGSEQVILGLILNGPMVLGAVILFLLRNSLSNALSPDVGVVLALVTISVLFLFGSIPHKIQRARYKTQFEQQREEAVTAAQRKAEGVVEYLVSQAGLTDMSDVDEMRESFQARADEAQAQANKLDY